MAKTIWENARSRYGNVSEVQYGKGMERYGRPLMPFNGRSAFKDAWEELVDLSNYLMQAEEEFINIAIYLYVICSVNETLHLLPAEILVKLMEVIGDCTLDELKEKVGIKIYAVETVSAEDIPSGSEYQIEGI